MNNGKTINHHTWTNEDDQFLMENYRKMKVDEISERLGRTVSAVRFRATVLKIPKADKVTCRQCQKEYPKTAEYFYLSQRKKLCKDCFNHLNQISKKERKHKMEWRKEVNEEQQWRDTIAKQMFTCKKCEETKTGDKMKLKVKKRKVESICKDCNNKATRENYLERQVKHIQNFNELHSSK